MKRVIAAASILAVLFALALVNNRLIENRVALLTENVNAAEAADENGDHDGAIRIIEQSLQNWLDFESYTHIMLRHSETELVIAEFFSLLHKLESEEGAHPADFASLRQTLNGIAKAEQLQWGSIL